MKFIHIISLFLLFFILSGCNSINTIDKETSEIFNQNYILLDDLKKYVDEDSTKSVRTKESIKTKIEYVKKTIKSLKVK